jgi:hypothetical protein
VIIQLLVDVVWVGRYQEMVIIGYVSMDEQIGHLVALMFLVIQLLKSVEMASIKTVMDLIPLVLYHVLNLHPVKVVQDEGV